MAKPLILARGSRKRGNPNWGNPVSIPPAAATEFELQVRKLGLTKQTCSSSTELHSWCERNRNRCYIPEWLLEAWGIPVDSNDGYGAPIQHKNIFERRFSRRRSP